MTRKPRHIPTGSKCGRGAAPDKPEARAGGAKAKTRWADLPKKRPTVEVGPRTHRQIHRQQASKSRKVTTMPTSALTTEVMKALPHGLRPNPYSIDDEVMTLVAAGWKPIEIAEACIRAGDREPGHAVTTIRGLQDIPAPSVRTVRQTGPVGHQPCPQHGDPCQLCACDPNQPIKHHVSVPMPEWFRAAAEAAGTQNDYDIALRYRGIDPEHLRHLLDTSAPDYTPTGADDYLAGLGIQ